MNSLEAEKIVKQYGKSIEEAGILARSKKYLRSPKAVIRIAFFTCLEALVRNKLLDQRTGETLVASYALLDTFVNEDEAREINATNDAMQTGNSTQVTEEQRTRWLNFVQNNLLNLELRDELNAYIAELQAL